MPEMSDPKKRQTERELMELAVALAEESIPENDGRAHPKVGAVISRDGHVLAPGFRGENTEGAHAEETACRSLRPPKPWGPRYTALWSRARSAGKWPALNG